MWLAKNNFVMFLCRLACCAMVAGLLGGCSSEFYKTQADKEVYKIIDSKWKEDLGDKSNYGIRGTPAAANDIQIENVLPPDGVVNLAQAVSLATAHNRDYQTRKEGLYLVGLDLTLVRHQFAIKWFGTIDTNYLSAGGDQSIAVGSEVGFTRLLAEGTSISTSIAIDWIRFLAGDPQSSLGSVLTATVRQPLLRGYGHKIVQEKLTQSDRDVLYSIRSFNRFRKEFVVSIVSDYYRILQQRDAVENAKNNYERISDSPRYFCRSINANLAFISPVWILLSFSFF